MQKARKRQRRSRQEIRRLLRDFRRSGLSQPAFAKSIGVHANTLYKWLLKERTGSSGKRQRVVPVRIKDGIFPSESYADLEVALANGRRIRLKPGFDKESLVKLIDVLEERC